MTEGADVFVDTPDDAPPWPRPDDRKLELIHFPGGWPDDGLFYIYRVHRDAPPTIVRLDSHGGPPVGLNERSRVIAHALATLAAERMKETKP